MEKGAYRNEEHLKGAVTANVPDTFRDLSLDHAPLGCLTGGVASRSEWQGFELSGEQVQQFWRDGYLSNIPVLTQQQCDKLLQDYQQFLDPDRLHEGHGLFYEFHRNQSGSPDNVLLHALGQWRITPAFHDLCFLPNIAVPAAQLIDPSQQPRAIRLWHDQLFSKPPHHGGVVAWHQDYSYWTRTTPMLHMTVHVALDDQTVETGGLHFIPGSHRWHRNGLPLPITDPKFGDMESVKSILTEQELGQFHPKPSGLKRGQASFHHPLTVHGSYANRSNQPRRAAVVNYFADGVESNTDESLLNGVPVIPKGAKMDGQFFPVVFDPIWAAEE